MTTPDSASPQTRQNTPLPVIANVSRIVAMAADRVTGDRSDYPLLVAACVVEALKQHGFQSRIMYGQAAWVEVLENHAVQWAGCWGESLTFWVQTEFAETVDLNTSVAWKKRSHGNPEEKPLYSPPILWSREVPRFYQYHPEGVAEVELTEEIDKKRFDAILLEIREKCLPELLKGDDEEFINEPILCPQRKLLDDSKRTFQMFDRTLAVSGIPELPSSIFKNVSHTHHH